MKKVKLKVEEIDFIEYERKTLNLDWVYDKVGPHYYKFQTLIKRDGSVYEKTPDASESIVKKFKESEIKELFERITTFLEYDNFEMENWFDDSAVTVIVHLKDGQKKRFDRGLKRVVNGNEICLYDLITRYLPE